MSRKWTRWMVGTSFVVHLATVPPRTFPDLPPVLDLLAVALAVLGALAMLDLAFDADENH